MANQDGSSSNVADLQSYWDMSEDIVAQHGRPSTMQTVEFIDDQNHYCTIRDVQLHIDDLTSEIHKDNGVLLYEGGEWVFGAFNINDCDRANLQKALYEDESSNGFFSTLASRLFQPKSNVKDNQDTMKPRFSTSDSITLAYGFKALTPKYRAIAEMVKKMQVVSSHSSTEKRIRFYIHGAFAMKPVSIYLSYLTLESHLDPVRVIPPWVKTAISLLLAIFIEFMFGHESGAIFNRTARLITRLTGLFLSATIFLSAIHFHRQYIVKAENTEGSANAELVTTNKDASPRMTQLYGELEIINSSIVQEEKYIETQNTSQNKIVKALEAERQVFLDKAKNYKMIYDRVSKRGSDKQCSKYKSSPRGWVNGACKPLSTINGYVNGQNGLASKKTVIINKYVPFSSSQMTSIQNSKAKKLAEIAKEQTTVIEEKNEVSNDSLEVVKVILFIIEIMSKMDLYGYFLARWNLRGNVIDEFEPKINESSSISQMTDIISQISHQNALVMKNQGDSLRITNEAIEGVNHSMLIGANLTMNSHARTLKQLIGAVSKQNIPSRKKASYQPVADPSSNVSQDRVSRTVQEIEEAERLLTSYVDSKGFSSHYVLLSQTVKVGQVVDYQILINSELIDEDLLIATQHELAHIVTGNSEHGQDFLDALEFIKTGAYPNQPVQQPVNQPVQQPVNQPVNQPVQQPVKQIDKGTQSMKKMKTYTAYFTPERRVQLMNIFFSKLKAVTADEKQIARTFGIWDDLNDIFDTSIINHDTFFDYLNYATPNE